MWFINTCKILQKYKSTNKLERSDSNTVSIWKKKATGLGEVKPLKQRIQTKCEEEQWMIVAQEVIKISLIEAILFLKLNL